MLNRRPGLILQQDKARPHTARYTQNVLNQNDIQTLNWSARSPDLSLIEHVWDQLGRQFRERHDVNNVRELEATLRIEWQNITMEYNNNPIDSMRRRCTAVVEVDGGRIPNTERQSDSRSYTLTL